MSASEILLRLERSKRRGGIDKRCVLPQFIVISDEAPVVTFERESDLDEWLLANEHEIMNAVVIDNGMRFSNRKPEAYDAIEWIDGVKEEMAENRMSGDLV